MSENIEIEYEHAQAMFHKLNSLHNAETWHGWLSAYFSVNPEPLKWYQKACEWLDIEELADDEMRGFLQLFSEWSLHQLSDTGGLIDLLLPSDNVSLVKRVAALALWAESFLLGFAERPADQPALSTDVKEALRDFADISQLTLDEDGGSANEQETNFHSIVEHVRVSVQLIFFRVCQF